MWLWGMTKVWIGLSSTVTPKESKKQIKQTKIPPKPLIFVKDTFIIPRTSLLLFRFCTWLWRHIEIVVRVPLKFKLFELRVFAARSSVTFTPETVAVNTAFLWRWDSGWRYKMSKNTRIALIFGGFVTAVAAAFYPIFFYPYMHKGEYSKCFYLL